VRENRGKWKWKWSGKKILRGQGKVREFYFEAGKIDILKKSQGKLKLY